MRDLANHSASIISSSWNCFQAICPISRVLKHRQPSAVRPSERMDVANRIASIISISLIFVQAKCPISRVLKQRQPVAIRPNDWKDLATRREHHEHQLDFFSSSLSDFAAVEPTASMAVRPSERTVLADVRLIEISRPLNARQPVAVAVSMQ